MSGFFFFWDKVLTNFSPGLPISTYLLLFSHKNNAYAHAKNQKKWCTVKNRIILLLLLPVLHLLSAGASFLCLLPETFYVCRNTHVGISSILVCCLHMVTFCIHCYVPCFFCLTLYLGRLSPLYWFFHCMDICCLQSFAIIKTAEVNERI